MLTRRELFALAAQAALPERRRIALITSSNRALARPASPEDPLDYERVRDMVWTAIRQAGGVEQRIRPGSWVVVKPNLVFLRPQSGYAPGDITDLRVIRAVFEYVGEYSKAGRITLAEGGSYRGLRDPAADNAVTQNGSRVDAMSFDWGPKEFPGLGGTIGGMLKDLGSRYKNRFDYVDLSYDAVRDASGAFRRMQVPKSKRAVAAFGGRPDYFVTNTITRCDFLISVPVMKVHEQCGITGCLKNYVGTAPREAYANPGAFWNAGLHAQHSVDNRIDPFIADLAAFHPPDFNVMDGIRGLQGSEHRNGRPDQTIRNNLVIASADPIAADALAAHLLGFNTWDIDFLHLGERRDMGIRDLKRADVAGDDPDRIRRTWAKPKNWYGRCNREWLISGSPFTSPVDTVRFSKRTTASVKVIADGSHKGYLWAGLRGAVTARLNGEQILHEENTTRYRVGQFQKPVELLSGENVLEFDVEPAGGEAMLSLLLAGPRNDGDSMEGISWRAV